MKALYQEIIPNKNHFGYIYASQIVINSVYSFLETEFQILA